MLNFVRYLHISYLPFRIPLRAELRISLWLVVYIVTAPLRITEASGNLTGLACLVYISLTGQGLAVS